MKLKKTLILFVGLSIVLSSCSSLGEAGKVLRNQKTTSTDEFLIKKQEPLSRPPDFEKIPEPGMMNEKDELKEASIEKILKTNKKDSKRIQTKPTSTEESILNKIKK